MAEMDAFERRLADALRRYADEVSVAVDAAELAHNVALEHPRRGAIGGRRPMPLGWPGHRLWAPVPILLVVGLLLALMFSFMQLGAPRGLHGPAAPQSTPTAIASPTPVATAPHSTPTATASPTPVATTDGVGDEYVTGTMTFSALENGTETKVGNVTQLRGLVLTGTWTMNDPRVNVTGTAHLSVDEYPNVNSMWGTMRLENANGAWEGTVTAASWNGGSTANDSGWLVGSGAYAGYTYYVHFWGSGYNYLVEGIIFQGSPPAP
jgi:hypothetical protein